MSYSVYQEFSKGDRVVFREWEDMANEFGTTNGTTGGGSILTAAWFIKDMRPLCGQAGTIDYFDQKDGEVYVLLDDPEANELAQDYHLTSDMFILEGEDTDVYVENENSLLSFVLGGSE